MATFAQSKKKQLIEIERVNDSLNLLISSRQATLEKIVQQKATLGQQISNYSNEIEKLKVDLANLNQLIFQKELKNSTQKQKLILLNQLNFEASKSINSENTEEIAIFHNVSSEPPFLFQTAEFNGKKIKIIGYDQQKKRIYYLDNFIDHQFDSWVYINSLNIQKEQKKQEDACDCDIELASILDLFNLNIWDLPTSEPDNVPIFTREGTFIYSNLNFGGLDNFYTFIEGNTKSLFGFVVFLKTIDL